MSDKYCYPNTNILKNKWNIRDKTELTETEIEITSAKLFELQSTPIKGQFDFRHLCKIHEHIFKDLFDWAGKPRTVDIGKGNIFCLVQYIPSYANDIFSKYYKECNTVKNDQAVFINMLTKHYADVNALHPFREGNGRTQREFARELCLSCGYAFDLTKTHHEEMLNASIASFNGDNTKLEQIFKHAITPIDNYELHNQKLQRTIQTLSSNDIPKNKNQASKMTRSKRTRAVFENYGQTTENTDDYSL